MINKLLKTAVVSLLLGTSIAEAREIRVSSFEPAQGFFSSKILQVWIDKINPKLSKGTKLKLFPGSILGSPPAQAELVKAGVADIALVVPAYTPGLFPMTGVMEVPGLVKTSSGGTRVLNTLLEDGSLKGEYANYKIVALFTTSGYRFFTKDKPVTSPEDLRGLKLRTPSKYGSELFDMVGASGVGLPAPQVYENLERGVVQGAVWVMDAYQTFRLNEVAPYITSTNFTAAPLAILMNKNTYASLSEQDKRVINEMSGRSTAEWIASVIDRTDAEVEEKFRKDKKVTFIDLDKKTKAAWDAALSGAATVWVSGQKNKENAQAILDRAISLSAD